MFTAGYNQPGYLPESDPAEFDTFDEAKRYVIGEVLNAADNVDDESDAEDLTALAELINLESEPFSTSIMGDGYVYWVAET